MLLLANTYCGIKSLFPSRSLILNTTCFTKFSEIDIIRIYKRANIKHSFKTGSCENGLLLLYCKTFIFKALSIHGEQVMVSESPQQSFL